MPKTLKKNGEMLKWFDTPKNCEIKLVLDK
jgi:hypothetical protein